MDNYDSVIAQLGKQVSKIAPQTIPRYSYSSNKWWKWRSYYAYALIPIAVIVILLVWRPGFMMQKNKEGKRSIRVKVFFIAVTILSVILTGAYVGYRIKFAGN